METLYQVLGLVAAGAITWIIYRMVKGRPELFSREYLSKSFFTLGVLGIILIGFVTVLILIVRTT